MNKMIDNIKKIALDQIKDALKQREATAFLSSQWIRHLPKPG